MYEVMNDIKITEYRTRYIKDNTKLYLSFLIHYRNNNKAHGDM